VSDAVSDAVLDAALAGDKASRVACETLCKTGFVVLAGEITTKATIDFGKVARQAIRDIGYTSSDMGFDADTCGILIAVEPQSPDISQGVTEGEGLFKEQGAGDQGLMFGYACDETPELMPAPIMYAHQMAKQLAAVRKANKVDFLRPDGKTQVTVEYENDIPKRIETVVLSTQHSESVKHKTLKEAMMELVVKKTLPKELLDKNTKYFINPTGRFVIGGPCGDAGLTGRKIIVDTYGGMGRHGGGATARPPTPRATSPRTSAPPAWPSAARCRSRTPSASPSRWACTCTPSAPASSTTRSSPPTWPRTSTSARAR
jgi:S-adenosylmethionine synthetase